MPAAAGGSDAAIRELETSDLPALTVLVRSLGYDHVTVKFAEPAAVGER